MSQEKEKFLQQLGGPTSLAGYQRSYKLVFLKCFFEYQPYTGQVPCYELASSFRQFYIDRKQQGLLPDVQADIAIANPESSSIESILNLILRNPFAALNGRDLIEKATISGDEYFVLPSQYKQSLDNEDISDILNLVDQKLDLYYASIEGKGIEAAAMRDVIEKFITGYTAAKQDAFSHHPFGEFVRNDIPAALYNTGLIDAQGYLITGSVGQGNWATVPWICIFDRSITTSATRGVYIVYLLSADTNTLYLTFNQGCTDIRSSHSKRDTIKIMREKAAEIVSSIDCRGFNTDEAIDLGSNLTPLAELYQRGTIFYKGYQKDSIPSEQELREDLSKMMDIYQEYANHLSPDTPAPGGEEELSPKETIDVIKSYIAAKGFSYENGLVENFYLSLKSKPFVILAGTSGTGKTRLVKLFAEAIGATTTNGRYQMVAVRPDWSDSSDLFGHVDLNGNFIPGTIIDFVKRAELDSIHPYILCLDEMNLARVEYYFSDVLSIMETRDFDSGRIVSDPLVPSTYYGSDVKAAGRYGTVRLPDNLYIIGTVNMDETTFPFSRKVLDRANTIEFSRVDLIPQTVPMEPVAPLTVGNDFLVTKYLLLQQCMGDPDMVGQYCADLQTINQILQSASAQVGYRVRDEIVFYLLNNKEAALLSEEDAMDNEIMQKILPRIQGSSTSVKNMLCELFKLCAGDYEGYQTESNDVSAKMMKAAQMPDCKYKKSAEKIAFMVRRYEEDGFTSYWL